MNAATPLRPRIRYRPITPADAPACTGILPPWLGLDAATHQALPALWARLADDPSVVSAVVEDLAQPPAQRVQGWGATIALPPAMVDRLELRTRLAPYVTRRVYQALIDGSLVPMNDRELGLENAGSGVTLLVLHFSMRRVDYADPYVHSVLNSANESFRVMHAGLHVREIVYETSAQDADSVTTAGFRQRPYADPDEVARLPPALRPMMLGLSHEEALASLPGTTARHVFDHQPPLFRLSASQRRLLRLALFEDSDDALLQALKVSPHGLKKLWRGIYERIEDAMPEFFGDAVGDDDGRRGPEKRRQVLAYMRQRPEELWPWVPALTR